MTRDVLPSGKQSNQVVEQKITKGWASQGSRHSEKEYRDFKALYGFHGEDFPAQPRMNVTQAYMLSSPESQWE